MYTGKILNTLAVKYSLIFRLLLLLIIKKPLKIKNICIPKTILHFAQKMENYIYMYDKNVE